MASIALRINFHPDQHLRRQRKLIVAAEVRQNEQKSPENLAKVNEAKKAKGGLEALSSRFSGISSDSRSPKRRKRTPTADTDAKNPDFAPPPRLPRPPTLA